MNAAGGKPTAYRGPFPFRDNVTCADFDSDGELRWNVGSATVLIYHNGLSWVMRISERGAMNHLMLGPNRVHLRRIWAAFDRVVSKHRSLARLVMVHGISFDIDEARQMRRLIGRTLRESQIA